jgi:hypothetical protein
MSYSPVIHTPDILNVAVLEWLAEHADEYPDAVQNIVCYERKYPIFSHMHQVVQAHVKNNDKKSLMVDEIKNRKRDECIVNKTLKTSKHKNVLAVTKSRNSKKTVRKSLRREKTATEKDKDKIVWIREHSSIGAEVAMYFDVDGKMKLYEGTVIKYGLPSADGELDHLYHIRFKADGDECDWGEMEFVKGLEDFLIFANNL